VIIECRHFLLQDVRMIRFLTLLRCITRGGRAALGIVATLLLVVAAASAGEIVPIEDGAPFDVRSAFLEPADRVYQLNATLDLSLSKAALQALGDGVPLLVELDLNVVRKRRYLPDEDVGSLTQRWRLRFDALSEHYLVENLNSAQQSSFPSLAAALADLAAVRALPVLDEALIRKGSRYEASMRLVTVVEGGLPNTLKYMMFWMDWRRSTDWYTWTVRP
jgi:hypothetical protein